MDVTRRSLPLVEESLVGGNGVALVVDQRESMLVGLAQRECRKSPHTRGE